MRAKSNQWRINHHQKLDANRLEKVQEMVDRYSIIHMVVMVAIGVGQVFVLKRFFIVKPTSTRIAAKT